MLEALIPASTTRGVVYLKPINVWLGPDKLRSLCRDTLEIEPDLSTAFLFSNAKRDCLVMYSLAYTGDRVLTKKLDKGAFVLPAPPEHGKPYSIMRPKMVGRLLRS